MSAGCPTGPPGRAGIGPWAGRVAALGLCLLALAGAAIASAAPAPAVEGAAVLIANGATGEVLYARSPRRKLPIASITKVMTVLLALEQARPSERVRISATAPTVGEATIDLRAGERLTVRELALGAMLPSANDAAYALAEHVGGAGGVRRFVRMMNARAEELGLEDTTFRRPDGLDTAGHLSSAHDVFELARAAMAHRAFRQIVGTRRAQISGGRTLVNRNDLLFSYRGTFGVKTGQTSGAGWCEVVAVRRDGITIYAVVLGSPSREQRNADLAELLDWGFEQYGRTVVINGDRTYAEARVPYREERALRLVAREPATVVVRWGRPLLERVVAPAMVALPIRAGQELGEVQVLDGARIVASRPLIATESIPAPGLGARIGWYADRALGHAGDLFGSVLGAIF